MIASLLVIASTLESVQIGEFFTLPAWLPRTVGSHDTPGSDPLDNPTNGWYVAEMTNGLTTGFRVPRAARLTPEVQAGVNSTFEGWCERFYYASQGQSNRWDVAEYGGKEPATFYLGHYLGSHLFPDHRKSTNRVVNTRRIDEYTNICQLANLFRDDYSGYSMEDFCEKPGWVAHDYNAKMFWSSTCPALREYGDEYAFIPVFNGLRDPTHIDSTNQYDRWECRCPAFARLAGDDAWPKYESLPDHPSAELMETVSFSQPYYNPENCAWANSNALTMASLITNTYPGVRYGGITNETRRLVSNRLCEMNQYLGMMDSTYAVYNLTYPTIGTNVEYQAYSFCSCVPNVSWTWNHHENRYDGTYERMDWYDLEVTNFIYGSSRNSSGCIHHRMSGTQTSYELVSRGSQDFVAVDSPSQVDMKQVADQFRRDIGWRSFYFEMTMTPEEWNGRPGIKYTISQQDLPWYTNIVTNVYHLAVSVPSNQVGTIRSQYVRRYSYAHTVGDVGIGATQPGFESEDRPMTNMLGIVTGIHFKGVNSPSLADMYWMTGVSDCIYDSRKQGYDSRGDIVRELRSASSDELSARIVALYGYDPNDWQTMIPITDDERVRNSTGLTDITLTIDFKDYDSRRKAARIEMVGWCAEDELYVIQGKTYYSDGTYTSDILDFYIGFVSYDYTNSVPNEYEIDALALDAKLGVMTRTDWKWKTLRRTDDNP